MLHSALHRNLGACPQVGPNEYPRAAQSSGERGFLNLGGWGCPGLGGEASWEIFRNIEHNDFIWELLLNPNMFNAIRSTAML